MSNTHPLTYRAPRRMSIKTPDGWIDAPWKPEAIDSTIASGGWFAGAAYHDFEKPVKPTNH